MLVNTNGNTKPSCKQWSDQRSCMDTHLINCYNSPAGKMCHLTFLEKIAELEFIRNNIKIPGAAKVS